MMTIHFKNGSTLEVSREVGDAINSNLMQGAARFQGFSDKEGKLLLIVNLEEVVYIK